METYSHEEIAGFEETSWWYVSRRRVLNDLLERFPAERGVLLDLGCGVGANFPVLAVHAQKVIGLDISEEALAHARARGYHETLLASAEDIPLPSDSVDAIVCADVLEHIDDTKTVAEIARVLKSRGSAYILVPAFPSLWNENDDYGHHLRRYKRGELVGLFARNNMQIRYSGFWNICMFPVVWLVARFYHKKPEGEKLSNSLSRIPAWINGILAHVIDVERSVNRRLNLPFGVSHILVAQKP